MYETFYGLREKPFHVTADASFLFPSREHQEAMAHLTYGINQRLGFLLITGEVGTGKTTLAKTLVGQLQSPIKTALLLNPSLSGAQLLQTIIRDFDASERSRARTTRLSTRGDFLREIEIFLLSLYQSGGNAVLIIDEAQAVSTSALETVRLLSNVETDKTKLIQIVLVGQPELSHRLKTDKRLRALNERIAVRYQVQPMSEEEVSEYIRHRLLRAGANDSLQFSPEAVSLISRLSGGVPRRINLLCDQALLAGFVRECQIIDEMHVQEAESTVSFQMPPSALTYA